MPRRKKTFLEKNFLSLVTLLLVLIVLLQRCDAPKPSDEPKIIRDTTWIIKDSTVYSKPQVIKTIPVNVYHDTTYREYLPDTNYQRLVIQYQDVVNQLLAKNIQADSLKIDSIGYVHVLDTVQKNLVVGRSFKYSLTYPVIKETVIMPPARKNQLYVGGEVEGSLTSLVSGINAGLLFKNKKDQIFGLKAGLTPQGQPNVGVSSFWKITLKK
jgi:hypothetical protein